MCANKIKWFHIGCVDFPKADLDKYEYFCSDCVERRGAGPGRTTGKCQVVSPPAAPWKSAVEYDDLPNPQDVKTQFWSQWFRERMRQSALVELRPVEDVTWAEYPSVQSCIQDHKEVTGAQVQACRDFALKLLQSLIVRMGQNNDIFTLEACSLFDHRPAAKLRNAKNRKKYLNHLLERSGVSDEEAVEIRSSCVAWFGISRHVETTHTTVSPRAAFFVSFGIRCDSLCVPVPRCFSILGTATRMTPGRALLLSLPSTT
jgi:hypothetical protein